MRQDPESARQMAAREAPRSAVMAQVLRRYPAVTGAAMGLVVCAMALAVLLLAQRAGGGASTVGATRGASAVCADLRARAYGDLYARLAPPLRGLGSEQQFIASQQQLDALRGAVTDCRYTMGRVNAASADVTFHLTRARGGQEIGRARLTLADGMWQLDQYDGDML